MTDKTEEKTIRIAGVRFRENWKVYDFDATDVVVAVGDRVIVDSERGPGIASVVRVRRTESPASPEPPAAAPASVFNMEIPEGIEIEIDGEEDTAIASSKTPDGKATRKVLRKATEADIAREQKNREREAEAFTMAQDMIGERELPMKLVRVEYSFDASRATFYFVSENRVDFRELVKDLAYKLKSRIEMRQIGVRDVARMIGGFGPCGRELCCSSFLKNFEPVSIRMAKKQEMVLNPAKISGVCGRLLCCLSYEYEMYEAIKKDAADLRQSALKDKKEEEDRRLAEERTEAVAQRTAEEKKRQEERRPQEQRREAQREGGQKAGGRPEKKKYPEKKAQAGQGDQARQRQQQPKQERQQKQQRQQQLPQQQPQPQQQQDQKTEQLQQEGEKSGKRKRRRFWRKKNKKQGPGDDRPSQGPGGS